MAGSLDHGTPARASSWARRRPRRAAANQPDAAPTRSTAGAAGDLDNTDLATGRAFRIGRDFIGSYDIGYVEPTPPVIHLGFAAAASAAMPAFFPPASLPTAGLGLCDAPPVLSLVDGGVYDNVGLEWCQGWGSG